MFDFWGGFRPKWGQQVRGLSSKKLFAFFLEISIFAFNPRIRLEDQHHSHVDKVIISN